MSPPLLLIGASVRAAAQSAQRAGFEPWAIDLFGDRDLREIAQTRVSASYPDDIPAIAAELPAAPFLYTGAIENAPRILAELCRQRTLWGNGPEVLARVRDPFRLQSFLRESGFPAVAVRRRDDPPDDPARWLVKPYHSGHGFGIAPASNQTVRSAQYYQQWLEGEPVGALFLANGRECRLIGTHQQLVGVQSGGGDPFQFCGAVAPVGLTAELLQSIAELGTSLTEMSGLTGLFGCDFLVNADGPWLLEVNPRYTAGVELWEALLARPLIGDHVRACRDGLLPALIESLPGRVSLKLILYAPQPTVVPDRLEITVLDLRGICLADLPAHGARIENGHPVCTLLVEADSRTGLTELLQGGLQAVGFACGWGAPVLTELSRSISERIASKFS